MSAGRAVLTAGGRLSSFEAITGVIYGNDCGHGAGALDGLYMGGRMGHHRQGQVGSGDQGYSQDTNKGCAS